MEEALDEQGCICYINITTGILLEQAITFIYQLLLHIFIKEPVEYVRQHSQIGVRLKNQISVFQLRILEYQIKDMIFTKGVRMIENNKFKGCTPGFSLLIICGSIAGQPAICNGYKL